MQPSDFTVADVLAWARTKPADERYDFTDRHRCAVAQFGLATGRDRLIDLLSEELRAVSEPLFEAVIADCKEWTFGGLVARLEALIPETVVPPSEWTRLDAYMLDIELASA